LNLSKLYRVLNRVSWENITLKNRSILLFASNAFAFVSYYLITFFLVRIFNKSDFGVFQQYQLVLVTIQPIFSFSLSTSLFYFYPISGYKDQKKIVVQSIALLIVSGITAASIVMLLPGLFLLVFTSTYLFELQIVMFFSILAIVVNGIGDFVFVATNDNKIMVIYYPLDKFMQFIFIVPTAYYSGDLKYTLFAATVFLVIKMIILIYVLLKKHYDKKILHFDKGLLVRQFKYCLPFYLGLVLYTISQKFDKILLNKYIDPADYALYAIAFLGIPLLSNMFAAVNNVSVPKIAEEFKLGNLENVRLLYRKIVSSAASIAIPALILFWILAERVIEILFSSEYVASAIYYKILLLSILGQIFSHGLILRGAGQTKQVLNSNVIGIVFTMISGFYLIPKFGLWGGVFTSLVSFFVPLVCQLVYESKLLKIKFFHFVPIGIVIKNISIAIFFSPIIYLLNQVLYSDVLVIGISVTFYPLTILFFQYKFGLTPFDNEISKVKNIFKRAK